MAEPFQRKPVPRRIVEVSGEGEPWAPREGQIIGAAVCQSGHVVLVMGDEHGVPVIEAHMTGEDVDAVIDMLNTAKRRLQQ